MIHCNFYHLKAVIKILLFFLQHPWFESAARTQKAEEQNMNRNLMSSTREHAVQNWNRMKKRINIGRQIIFFTLIIKNIHKYIYIYKYRIFLVYMQTQKNFTYLLKSMHLNERYFRLFLHHFSCQVSWVLLGQFRDFLASTALQQMRVWHVQVSINSSKEFSSLKSKMQ